MIKGIFMEINEIKLIMLTEYQKQFNKLFDKFKIEQLDLKGLINNINSLNLRYNCLRVDIKNRGSLSNDIELLEYGKNISMYKPDWLKDKWGIGCQLEECQGDFKFIFKCINSGNLKITIRGIDFRDIDNNRIPIYVNFTNLTINNDTILNQNYLVWHDEPYILEKTCENQQLFYFDLKYKTLFDYFPQLNLQISPNTSEYGIIEIYSKVNKYINMINLFIK